MPASPRKRNSTTLSSVFIAACWLSLTRAPTFVTWSAPLFEASRGSLRRRFDRRKGFGDSPSESELDGGTSVDDDHLKQEFIMGTAAKQERLYDVIKDFD